MGIQCVHHLVPLPVGDGLSRKVRSYLRLRHGHLAGVSKSAIEIFERELERHRPNAVVFDSGLFGPMAVVAKRFGCKVFTQTHNCEYDFYAGEAALRGGIAGELLRAAHLAESQAMEASDVVFVLSAYDRDRLQQLYGGLAECLVVNPHVQKLAERLENRITRAIPSTSVQPRAVAVFLGSAGHQNRLACALLARRWTGQLARLQIVGSVGDSLRAAHTDETLAAAGIETLGFVDSVDALLETASAMVCPMHLGSGIKIKMIDALANGCPVLASVEAMHGFEFARDSGWVRACALDDMEWATVATDRAELSIERLLADTSSEAARQAVALRDAYASHGLIIGGM